MTNVSRRINAEWFMTTLRSWRSSDSHLGQTPFNVAGTSMDRQGIQPMTKPWIIHTDGAARGNPGPAAYAFVITRPEGTVIEDKGKIGTATNNVAEYSALIHALERAAQEGAEH